MVKNEGNYEEDQRKIHLGSMYSDSVYCSLNCVLSNIIKAT